MERLTFHVSNDVVRLICRIEEGACVGKTYTCPDTHPGCPEIIKALNKLAAYEDTGLEPDSIEEAKEAVGRAAIELAYYHKAEQEGRLLVLPCKAGGDLWVNDRDGKPRRMVLDTPDIRCHCAKEDNLCMTLCDSPNAGICAYRLKNDGTDFGKTVFLTREEAEEKLKEKNNG